MLWWRGKNRTEKTSGSHRRKGLVELFYRARQTCCRTCLSQEKNQRVLCSFSTYLSFNIRKFRYQPFSDNRPSLSCNLGYFGHLVSLVTVRRSQMLSHLWSWKQIQYAFDSASNIHVFFLSILSSPITNRLNRVLDFDCVGGNYPGCDWVRPALTPLCRYQCDWVTMLQLFGYAGITPKAEILLGSKEDRPQHTIPFYSRKRSGSGGREKGRKEEQLLEFIFIQTVFALAR